MVNWFISKLLLRDSSGNPSWSISLAVMAFFVTTFIVLFGGVTFSTEYFKIVFPKPDTGLIAMYFPVSLGLYFGRRYTEAKFNGKLPPSIGGLKPRLRIPESEVQIG